MKKIIESLKNAVHESIKDYQQKANFISDRRSHDIWQIKEILKKNHLDLSECIADIQDYLDTMKTGWWFIETGNSVLKDNVNKVIKTYDDPLLRVLVLRSNSSDLTKICEALKDLKELNIIDIDIDIDKDNEELISEVTEHQVKKMEKTVKLNLENKPKKILNKTLQTEPVNQIRKRYLTK